MVPGRLGRNPARQEPSRSVCIGLTWLLNAGLAVCLKDRGTGAAWQGIWVLGGQEVPGAEDKALTRWSVRGAPTPGCTELGSNSSRRRVLHFTCSGKKYFPLLILGIFVFQLIMHLFIRR